MTDSYFRIIAGPKPVAFDFTSAKQRGSRLRSQQMEREWADGISVFDTLDAAIDQARRFPRLGTYVVELKFADSTGIEVRQTTSNPSHFTIYRTGPILLEFIVGDPIRVNEAQRNG